MGTFRSTVPVAACAATMFTSFLISSPGTVSADVADFYKGRQMTLYSAYAPGSTYSVYARTMSHHLERLIPGKPTIINKSMTGGGGILLGNYLYKVAPQDGSIIAAIGRDLATEPLLFGTKSKAEFDAREFTWLGSVNSEVSISAAWHTSGVNTLEDLRKKELIVASNSPTAQSSVFPSAMNAFIGTKFKTVCCYAGGNLMNFAMERGEVQGRATWSWSSVKASAYHWYESGKIKIVSQQALEKHPDLPHVPLVIDFAENAEDKAALKLLFHGLSVGRPYVSTPGLPADRAKALRAAFKAMLTDKEFLADAKKRRLEINQPKDGATVERMLAEIYQTPREIVARAAAATQSTRVIQRKVVYRTVQTRINEVGKRGSSVSFEDDGETTRAFLNRRATEVTIAGKKAKSGEIKPGMACAVTYEGNNTLAKTVACQ